MFCGRAKGDSQRLAGVDPDRFVAIHVHRSKFNVHLLIAMFTGQISRLEKPTVNLFLERQKVSVEDVFQDISYHMQ